MSFEERYFLHLELFFKVFCARFENHSLSPLSLTYTSLSFSLYQPLSLSLSASLSLSLSLSPFLLVSVVSYTRKCLSLFFKVFFLFLYYLQNACTFLFLKFSMLFYFFCSFLFPEILLCFSLFLFLFFFFTFFLLLSQPDK